MSKIILALYVIATSSALIFLKLGSAHGAPLHYANNRLQFNLTVYSVLGIFLYGFSFLLYTYLISKNDLGYIIPLTTAFVYVAIFTASYFIFKEVFTVTKIFGIVLILAGLIFLNLKK
jgi:drug/metabolite transporter (DMT)-like permease